MAEKATWRKIIGRVDGAAAPRLNELTKTTFKNRFGVAGNITHGAPPSA